MSTPNRYLEDATGRPIVIAGRSRFGLLCLLAILAVCALMHFVISTRSMLLGGFMEALLFALIIAPFLVSAWRVEETRLLGEAAAALRKGDSAAAVRVAQSLLLRRVRWDLEMRALYIIGLVAERNADFAEAQSCFRLLLRRLPNRAKRCALYARCHFTHALAALGRLDEAEREAKRAWDQAVTPPYFANDEKVARAVLDLEQGRDPVVLIDMARATIAETHARACLELAGPFRSAALSYPDPTR